MEKKSACLVINFNGRRYLEECFSSLLNQSRRDFDIYLVDNSSTDGSVAFTAKNFPLIKIIANTENYGFAQGYNRAIALIDAEYIALVNADTKADPDWFENLIHVFEMDKNIAIAGSKLLFYDHPDTINSAGIKLTFAGIGYDIGFGRKDNGLSGSSRSVGAVCGAAMMVRKSVFSELGGFDPDYFLICEDTDLCWRAWLAGYKVVIEPSSHMFHKFGWKIGGRHSGMRVYYSQKNAIITAVKNLGAARLALSLAIIGGYTLLKLAVYALFLRRESLSALFRATISALIQFPRTLAKRRMIQRKRKITDHFLEREGLLDSFVKAAAEYLRVNALQRGF